MIGSGNSSTLLSASSVTNNPQPSVGSLHYPFNSNINIEFVTYKAEFVPCKVEFVTCKAELVPCKVEFVTCIM